MSDPFNNMMIGGLRVLARKRGVRNPKSMTRSALMRELRELARTDRRRQEREQQETRRERRKRRRKRQKTRRREQQERYQAPEYLSNLWLDELRLFAGDRGVRNPESMTRSALMGELRELARTDRTQAYHVAPTHEEQLRVRKQEPEARERERRRHTNLETKPASGAAAALVFQVLDELSEEAPAWLWAALDSSSIDVSFGRLARIAYDAERTLNASAAPFERWLRDAIGSNAAHAARLEAACADPVLPQVLLTTAIHVWSVLIQTAEDDTRRAHLLCNLAVHLAAVGQRAEALTKSGDAVATYRRLADINPATYEPHLARSLNNHAVRLADAGQRDEALEMSGHAVTIYRRSGDTNAQPPRTGDSSREREYVLALKDSLMRALIEFGEDTIRTLELAGRADLDEDSRSSVVGGIRQIWIMTSQGLIDWIESYLDGLTSCDRAQAVTRASTAAEKLVGDGLALAATLPDEIQSSMVTALTSLSDSLSSSLAPRQNLWVQLVLRRSVHFVGEKERA